MSQYICVICTKPIPDELIERRHYSPAKPIPPLDEMVCSRECSVELRRREGQYKDMSVAGSSARSQSVAQSNRDKPRRRKERHESNTRNN